VQLIQDWLLKNGASAGQGLEAEVFRLPIVLFAPAGLDPLGLLVKQEWEELSNVVFDGHWVHFPLVMLKIGVDPLQLIQAVPLKKGVAVGQGISLGFDTGWAPIKFGFEPTLVAFAGLEMHWRRAELKVVPLGHCEHWLELKSKIWAHETQLDPFQKGVANGHETSLEVALGTLPVEFPRAKGLVAFGAAACPWTQIFALESRTWPEGHDVQTLVFILKIGLGLVQLMHPVPS